MSKTVKAQRSLEEFAPVGGLQRGPRCWVCLLPQDVRAKIEQARASDRQRYSIPTLVRWLREERGLPGATLQKLTHHFAEHVARK